MLRMHCQKGPQQQSNSRINHQQPSEQAGCDHSRGDQLQQGVKSNYCLSDLGGDAVITAALLRCTCTP